MAQGVGRDRPTLVSMPGRPVWGDRQFVGRDRELELIADACANARDGRGRLLVVRAAAGVGKTMLCEQAAQRAELDGFAVGWGRCWSDGGAPPLWPWSAVLAELIGPDGARLLAEDSGRHGLDPERFARFVAVGDVLAERARAKPLMVVIDDAHVADTAALLLARFLVRSLDQCPVVMLLTRRPGGDLTEQDSGRALDQLEREASVVALAPFGERDTAAFLVAHGMHVEDYGLVPALTRITDGNPLLLEQAVTRGSSSHAMAGLEHVIGDALAGLSQEHRRVVGLAAVLGTEATTDDVMALADEDPGVVLEALGMASTAGLVDIGPAGCVFTHELVRVAALRTLTPVQMLDAHGRAVDLAPADLRPTAVTRRAHHALVVAARSDVDAMRAVAECRAAARVLARGFDYERAASLLDSARELAERLTPPAEHADLLLEWADALLTCGRLIDARAAYADAADAADLADDPRARARAALGLGGVWLDEHRAVSDRRRVLGLQRAALDALPVDEHALRARLCVRLAAEAVYDGGDVAPVLAALDAARRVGDPLVLAEALSLTHHALLAPEHLDERMPLADELIKVASSGGDGLRVLFGLLWRTVDLYLIGDVRAERSLGELRQRAEAVGCRSISYVVAAIDVMRLIRAGRLDDAEVAADECFELGVEVGDADATGYYGAHLLTIRWLQDRDGELLGLARDVADSPTLVAPEFGFRAAVALIAARAGQRDEATSALQQLASDGLDTLPRSSTWLAGMVNITVAAQVLGDGELARQAYQLLRPFAARPAMPSLAVSCFGSVEWPLGLAAMTAGEIATAVDHLERAVEANRLLNNRSLTAVARADLAEALIARRWVGDVERGMAEMEGAASSAREIGLHARAARWGQRARDLGTSIDDAADAVLRREGNRWIVAAGEHRVVAPDLVGFGYLGTLLANPGKEIPAVELCGGSTVEQAGHDVLDRDALDSYRQRVRQIDDDLAEADAATDPARAQSLRDEREALRSELAAVLAVSGRSRRFADSSERARTAVRKAIARAIEAVAVSDDDLAAELRTTITTGRSCSYVPDTGRPRRWSVLAGR